MSWPPPGDDPTRVDSAVLADWIAKTAERKGVSKQELLEEVLSSYWVLEELSEIIGTEESENREPTRGRSVDPNPNGESVTEGNGGASKDLQRELQELRGVIQQLAMTNAGSNSRHGPSSTRGGDHVNVLEERLRSYESRLDEIEAKLETQDELIEALSEQVERLTVTLEDKADEEMVTSECTRLEREHNAFVEQVDAEFSNIEQLFEHVLERSDTVEYQLESTADRLIERLTTTENHAADREQLIEIKEKAMVANISAGDCGQCGQTVDLSLLEQPYCPSCDRGFTGVEPGGWLPFQRATITTDQTQRVSRRDPPFRNGDTSGPASNPDQLDAPR